MGLDEDPEDHNAVAGAIFISVAVYAVRLIPSRMDTQIDQAIGIFRILRVAGLARTKTEPERSNLVEMITLIPAIRITRCSRHILLRFVKTPNP